jgi:hypothetical protein
LQRSLAEEESSPNLEAWEKVFADDENHGYLYLIFKNRRFPTLVARDFVGFGHEISRKFVETPLLGPTLCDGISKE